MGGKPYFTRPPGVLYFLCSQEITMADKSKNEYFDLMAKRKAMLFQGNEEEAAKLLELAEELARSGKVSDDEMIAAAYI